MIGGRGIRRLTAWACALILAAAAASACSTDSGAAGAQPSASSAAGPGPSATPSGGGGSGSGGCDPEAASPAPNADAVNGPDVRRLKNKGVITVGVAADQYLTGYLGADGVEEGFDIDLAHALAQALFGDPAKVRFVALSTADRIPALQSGEVDFVIDTMTITCARLAQVGFSAVYFEASQRLLVTKGSPYSSIGQLRGQKVCAQTASTSIDQITAAKAVPVAKTDITDCLVLLQQNEVAAISTDDTLLAGLARQDPNLAVVGPRLEPEPYGIAMPAHQSDLEQYVNGVLARYTADPGGWAASYARWFGSSLPPAQPPVAQYSK